MEMELKLKKILKFEYFKQSADIILSRNKAEYSVYVTAIYYDRGIGVEKNTKIAQKYFSLIEKIS